MGVIFADGCRLCASRGLAPSSRSGFGRVFWTPAFAGATTRVVRLDGTLPAWVTPPLTTSGSEPVTCGERD